VVLGGTAEEGAEDRTPDAATTAAIRARCATLVPALRDAPVVGVAVGLRPARPTVRLEAEGRVVHCYGHGGAGVTLAWGCAGEVAALLGGGDDRYAAQR
jgi:D-amino-acid oxidase